MPHPYAEIGERMTDIVEIGKGAFATVYNAYDRALGFRVALKVVSELQNKSPIDAMAREIKFFQRCNHRNIVKCFDVFGESEECMIMVLELVTQGDLEQDIIARKSRPIRLFKEIEIWEIFAQIADAVAYLHDAKILHRDLKPANVLIARREPSMMIKLTDFGLSRKFDMTNAGARTECGTPYYNAPERMKDDEYGFPSEVWSLGCILYELVTLCSPFFGELDNFTSLVEKVTNAVYPPIPLDVYSMQIKFLIENCLKSDYSKRPSARQVSTLSFAVLDTVSLAECGMSWEMRQITAANFVRKII